MKTLRRYQNGGKDPRNRVRAQDAFVGGDSDIANLLKILGRGTVARTRPPGLSMRDMVLALDKGRDLEGNPVGTNESGFPNYDNRVFEFSTYNYGRDGGMDNLFGRLLDDADRGYKPAQDLLTKYGVAFNR
jgi:hypothetical protein